MDIRENIGDIDLIYKVDEKKWSIVSLKNNCSISLDNAGVNLLFKGIQKIIEIYAKKGIKY